MRRLYYQMWVDALNRAEQVQIKRGYPDGMFIVYLNIFGSTSLLMYFNMMQLNIIFHFFHIIPESITYTFKLEWFGIEKFNSLFAVAIQSSPMLLLNYFLIFYKKRYKKLREKYPPNNHIKIFGWYSIGTLTLFPIMVLVDVVREYWL